MKIGRNDPCPCGSGKKYKKCCIDKELEPEEIQESEIFSDIDDDEEEINEEWKLFEESDYEAKIAMFMKVIDNEEPPDSDTAFDMLAEIHTESVRQNERKRMDGLLDTLRQRWPDVYAQDAHWYLKWQINDALTDGHVDIVPSLAAEMAKTAGDEIDAFNWVLDMLAYHGQLKVLLDSMQIAWPSVEESEEILPYGINEFDERRTDYIVFNYLEEHGSLDASDKALLKSLEIFDRINANRLERYLKLMNEGLSWTLDQVIPNSKLKDQNELITQQQNLCDLTIEFSGYLRRKENIPYPRGEMARREIMDYLFEREEGKLEDGKSMFEAVIREMERRHKTKHTPMKPIHPLCPDSESLDLYMTKLLHFTNPQEHRAAALFETIPAWLQFLKFKNLLNEEEQEKVLADLEKLIPDLLKLWEKYPEEPAFIKALECWRTSGEKKMVLANSAAQS